MAIAIAVIAGWAATGCTDADSKFDDFGDRIVDASPVPDAEPPSTIPDINGRFFLAVSPSPSPDDHLLFIAQVSIQINGDTAILNSSGTPLDYTTRMPVGDPILFTDVAVDMNAEWSVTVEDLMVPAEANPITGSLLVASTAKFDGRIQNADRFCGDLSGMLSMPAVLSLDDSTFAAIRVSDTAIGDELPPEQISCDIPMAPDAGVPPAYDAAPPSFDATPPTPDATPPAPDAAPPAAN